MDTMSRAEAIKVIRAKLMEMVDDDHSMCRVATEKGIFCRGFQPLADQDMKRRYDWLLHRNPNMGRAELEDLANRWQIARQIVDRVPISCDVQTIERDTCGGWDTFDDGTLARFLRELTGSEVAIRN